MTAGELFFVVAYDLSREQTWRVGPWWFDIRNFSSNGKKTIYKCSLFSAWVHPAVARWAALRRHDPAMSKPNPIRSINRTSVYPTDIEMNIRGGMTRFSIDFGRCAHRGHTADAPEFDPVLVDRFGTEKLSLRPRSAYRAFVHRRCRTDNVIQNTLGDRVMEHPRPERLDRKRRG